MRGDLGTPSLDPVLFQTEMFHVKHRGLTGNGQAVGRKDAMAKVLAVVNQKGGVGKTTTTVNLTAALGMLGKKCLLVDIDPQGNATSGLGIDKRQMRQSTYELLIGSAKPVDVVVHTAFRQVDLLPSSMQLAGAEIEMVELNRRESRLKGALAALREAYEYILIDGVGNTGDYDPGAAHAECSMRGGHPAGADPVRILCAGGVSSADGYGAAGQTAV